MQLVDLNPFVRYDCNDIELGGWSQTVDDNVGKKTEIQTEREITHNAAG